MREAVHAPFVIRKEWIEKEGRKRTMRMKTMPEDLVYIIHTSGSTGKPKGVCIQNSNLSAFTVVATRQSLTR